MENKNSVTQKKKLKWKRIYYFPYFSIPTPTSISPSFHSTKHYSNDISWPHICIKYSSHWATLFFVLTFLWLGEWTGEGRGKVLIISMLECMKIYKMNHKFNKISARGKWTFEITNFTFFFSNFYLETATVPDTLAGVWMSSQVSLCTKNTSGFNLKRLQHKFRWCTFTE